MSHPKRPNQFEQDRFVLAFENGSLTADTDAPLMEASRRFRINKAKYINPTGLAEDPADYFDIQVKNEALVILNWSTQTGEEGTLAAGTWVTLSDPDDTTRLVFESGEELSLTFDETGDTTLPAGRLVLECSYL